MLIEFFDYFTAFLLARVCKFFKKYWVANYRKRKRQKDSKIQACHHSTIYKLGWNGYFMISGRYCTFVTKCVIRSVLYQQALLEYTTNTLNIPIVKTNVRGKDQQAKAFVNWCSSWIGGLPLSYRYDRDTRRC